MQERYISVSGTRSDILVLSGILVPLLILLTPVTAMCTVVDRVVASVDDLAITQSELYERFRDVRRIDRNVTLKEVLEGMINRILILRDARRFRLSGEEDSMIRQYIDLKVRALIRIDEDDVENYYRAHSHEFSDRGFDEVREEITKYLTEQEVNRRLRIRLEALRRGAHIRILFDRETGEDVKDP